MNWNTVLQEVQLLSYGANYTLNEQLTYFTRKIIIQRRGLLKMVGKRRNLLTYFV